MAISLDLSAATWYVDHAALGVNNGTNWANAWTNFGNIAWGRVDPGDLIQISGGLYGNTNSPLTIDPARGGISNAPITLKASREPGHNDPVIIHGGFTLRHDWITIDGAKDDFYGERWITNTVNVPSIRSNLNLRIHGGVCVNYTGPGPKGLRILWCELTTAVDRPETYGVRINAMPPHDMEASEIGFCWIHNVGQDAVKQFNGVEKPKFDELTIHHCLIEQVGDDGLEINQGTTVHHCIIRDTLRLRGHPDGIQSVGNYQRYYNNVISDFSSSYVVTQGVTNEDGIYGPIQIYGNLLYPNKLPCSSTMVELKWFPMGWNVRNTMSYSNWAIVNNTIIGSTNGNFGIYKRDNLLTNVALRSIRWINNITYDAYSWVGSIPHGPDRAGTGSWDGPPEEVIFDYNTIAHGTRRHGPRNQPGSIQIALFGQKWPSAIALSRATVFRHNSNTPPVFVDEDKFDYRLASNDQAMRDTGMDLSSLGLPDLERDLFGNRRGFGLGWDRGAMECVPVLPHSDHP